MIEASRRMIMMNRSQGEEEPGGGINPAIKGCLELKIKTLQNAHLEMRTTSWSGF